VGTILDNPGPEGAWIWKARYDDLEILDGTQWEISIRHGARSIATLGSNRYPHEFQQFLAAVEALIRRPFGK
jgi:hypothetical protein